MVHSRTRAAKPSTSKPSSPQNGSAFKATAGAVMAWRAASAASASKARINAPVSQAPRAARALLALALPGGATARIGGGAGRGSSRNAGHSCSPARARAMAWAMRPSDAPASRADRAVRPRTALRRGSAQASVSPSHRATASITACSLEASTGAASAAARRLRRTACRVARLAMKRGVSTDSGGPGSVAHGRAGAARPSARLDTRPA